MGQDETYLAAIIMFAGNFAPRGWAICNGQLLPINQYQALFSLLGTTYGGDGRTTFALPDLRGRAPISPGNGPGLPSYRQGVKGGEPSHILSINEMPAHSHTAQATVIGAISVGVNNEESDGSSNPDGNFLGQANGKYNGEDETGSLGGVSANLSANVTTLYNGGNLEHNNMQPFIAINYIIALQGIFPSRS